MNAPHELRTERLIMRCWKPEDAPALRASLDRSAQHLRPWVPFMRSEPRSLEVTRQWLSGRREWFVAGVHFCYGMFSPDESELIGEITVINHSAPGEFEIGYWVGVQHVGHGYALEGAATLTRVCFEHLEGELIEIKFATENIASGVIPKRLGYTHECTRAKRYVDCNDERWDLEGYILFREDFSGSPSEDFEYQALDALGRPHALDQK